MERDVPKYLPGLEPDNIKNLLDQLFSEIDHAFPNGTIIWDEWNHARWDKAAAYLSNYLGYSSGMSFLNAYGYSVVRTSDDRAREIIQAKKPLQEETESIVSKENSNKKKNSGKKRNVGAIACVVIGLIIVFGILFLIIPQIDTSITSTAKPAGNNTERMSSPQETAAPIEENTAATPEPDPLLMTVRSFAEPANIIVNKCEVYTKGSTAYYSIEIEVNESLTEKKIELFLDKIDMLTVNGKEYELDGINFVDTYGKADKTFSVEISHDKLDLVLEEVPQIISDLGINSTCSYDDQSHTYTYSYELEDVTKDYFSRATHGQVDDSFQRINGSLEKLFVSAGIRDIKIIGRLNATDGGLLLEYVNQEKTYEYVSVNAIIKEIDSVFEKNLGSAYRGYSKSTSNGENFLDIKICVEGSAEDYYYNTTDWQILKKEADDMCLSAKKKFERNGYNDWHVVIHFLNDYNRENVLYTILDGVGLT